MNTVTSSPKSLHDLAESVASRINPDDINLTRYSMARFKSHIKDCCRSLHYIEAYTLTLQYVEDLFYFFADDNHKLFQTDTPKVLSILSGLNIVDSNLYTLFSRVNDERNLLVHKIIRAKHESTRKNFGKMTPKEHENKLTKLIELAENEYMSLVKKFPYKFRYLKSKTVEYDRMILLAHIIMDRVFTELAIPKELRSKKEQVREYYRKAFFEKFQKDVLEYIFPKQNDHS